MRSSLFLLSLLLAVGNHSFAENESNNCSSCKDDKKSNWANFAATVFGLTVGACLVNSSLPSRYQLFAQANPYHILGVSAAIGTFCYLVAYYMGQSAADYCNEVRWKDRCEECETSPSDKFRRGVALVTFMGSALATAYCYSESTPANAPAVLVAGLGISAITSMYAVPYFLKACGL